jgi:hypothetical protein
LAAVAKAAVRFCGAQDAFIALEDGDSWVRAAHKGPIETPLGERVALNRETPPGRAIIEGRTCHVPDIEAADPHDFAALRALALRYGFRASLAAPLLREGRAIGALTLRKDRAEAFTTQQIALLEGFAAKFDHGAAIVLHSTTKYIGGHGTSIGGILADGGNFDWAKHKDRFPMLNQPDPSYHGAVWVEATKPMGPVNAFMFIQGLETLPLRMREHCPNASAVAKHLSANKKITKVIHPSLMTGEAKIRADAHLSRGYGGLVGFELGGGMEAGRKFIDALKLFYHVANIGDARSLAIHPASTTHSQLSAEEQAQTGVTPGYVRLSIGIEHIDDILADLDQALATV